MKTIEELEKDVLDWANDKNLLNPEVRFKQALKMVSEVGETCDAVISDDLPEIEDGIGDIIVTLIILANQHGLDLNKCLQAAYDVIKGRTGNTINGVFIKDDEPDEPLCESCDKPIPEKDLLMDGDGCYLHISCAKDCGLID